jgi:hypothetical protein
MTKWYFAFRLPPEQVCEVEEDVERADSEQVQRGSRMALEPRQRLVGFKLDHLAFIV